jgi:hypothetical protein
MKLSEKRKKGVVKAIRSKKKSGDKNGRQFETSRTHSVEKDIFWITYFHLSRKR